MLMHEYNESESRFSKQQCLYEQLIKRICIIAILQCVRVMKDEKMEEYKQTQMDKQIDINK